MEGGLGGGADAAGPDNCKSTANAGRQEAGPPMREIREARPREFRGIAELAEAAYRALDGHFEEDYARELRDVHGRAASACVLVADDAGRVVGTVTYVPGPGPFAEFDGADEVGIRMLAVDPAVQGRGIGTALVEACIERAHADGKSRIVLHSTPWMTAAHRIYEKIGFRRAPEIDLLPYPSIPLQAFVLDLGFRDGVAVESGLP